MIKLLLKIFFIILIAALQVTLMPHLAIFDVWPNIVLILAILLVFLDFIPDSYLLAGIGGLVLDLSGPLRMGTNIIILIALISALRFINTKYFPESNALIIFISIITSSLLYSLIELLLLHQGLNFNIFFEAFYAGLLAEIILFIFNFKHEKESLIKIE